MQRGATCQPRFYAVAAELYSLYAQAEWTREQCFPQTAQGDLLDLHGQLRGVTRREADYAQGIIRFSVDAARDNPVPIAQGTVCMTAGQLRFVTVEAGTIEAGALYADVKAQAVEAGAAGNVTAGTILIMAVAPTAVSACVNPEAFAGRPGPGGRREPARADPGDLCPAGQRSQRRLLQADRPVLPPMWWLPCGPRSRGVGTVDVVVATQAGVPEDDLLEEIGDHHPRTCGRSPWMSRCWLPPR